MSVENLQPGDMIFAATHVYNDGSVPGVDTDACIAAAGTRGVLINTGHLEEDPDKILMLVRFEDQNMNLGPPVACWPDELSAEPITA
jgi:nitrogen fixation protein NifZ